MSSLFKNDKKGVLMTTNSDLIVAKHNTLVEASYKLTLNEQRLILSCIAQLDSRKPLPKDNLFIVTAEQFAETFNVPQKKAYEYLEQAAETLYNRDIRTHDSRYRKRFRWVYAVQYHNGQSKVTLGFSPWVAPYLTMLHKHFTSYRLRQVANLRSTYSIRLYELLMQFAKIGKREITLEKFKQQLELENKYNRFFDIKRRIIEPAVQELRRKSNLIIEWKTIRKGRTVTALSFVFQEDPQGRLPL